MLPKKRPSSRYHGKVITQAFFSGFFSGSCVFFSFFSFFIHQKSLAFFCFFYFSSVSGGLSQDPTWDHFDHIAHKTGWQARCRCCNTIFMGKLDDLLRHLATRCKLCAEDVQADAQAEFKRKKAKRPPEKREPVPPSPFQHRQFLLPVVKTDMEQQNAIDCQISRFVVATNSAFSIVENPEFHRLVSLLRPGTTVPDRHRLGGQIFIPGLPRSHGTTEDCTHDRRVGRGGEAKIPKPAILPRLTRFVCLFFLGPLSDKVKSGGFSGVKPKADEAHERW